MGEISLKAEELFHLGTLPVTNTLVVSTMAMVILIVGALLFYFWRRPRAGSFQNIVEVIIEELLDLMESVLGSRGRAERYLPLVATIFVFVLTSNWLGLLPGFGSIVVYEGAEAVPLFRAPGSDLNFTLAIALISVIAANLLGIAAVGLGPHLKKFFDFSGPIGFFVGLLELVSEFAKIVSFSFRLFGNVFAGEVLLMIVGFLMAYLVPLPFMFLEIFVGFIQAFVFSMLTLVFLSLHTTIHERGETSPLGADSTPSVQKVEP